jgi:hypothetical protein
MLVSLATVPARPDRDNEDFASVTTDTLVLLDGAGTPAGSESGCQHGVAWFSRQLGAQFLAESVKYPHRPLSLCLSQAIGHVRDLHKGTCDLAHPGTPSSTVIAVRLNAESAEYLVLADSVLVFDLADGDPAVLTDDRESLVGRAHRVAMDALPGDSSEHDKALREYVETLQRYRNSEGGFWVAASDPAAADHALTGSIPRGSLHAIALLSDGASRLVDRFHHLTDWTGALKILRQQGPQELITQVRIAEHADPRGERWPRGKTYDDATAVYAVISAEQR